MRVQIREDSVEIDGYVNAVERKSKPLRSRMGQFIERICKGAFGKALKRNDNVRLLLNHDWNRDLGGTKEGNLELAEDAIGLRARATVTDPEVIDKARNGDLVGWSFGFEDVPDGVERSVEDGMPTRSVKDLNLKEVSILDRSRTPAYDGTMVSVRSEEDFINHGEDLITDVEIRELPTEEKPQEEELPLAIDYSKYEEWIKEMKGEK